MQIHRHSSTVSLNVTIINHVLPPLVVVLHEIVYVSFLSLDSALPTLTYIGSGSGSGSVVQENEVIYYCPGVSEVLSFRCEVQNSARLVWEILPINQRFSFTFNLDPIVVSIGNVTAILESVVESNLSSLLLINTMYLATERDTEVVCESPNSNTSISIRPLGKPILLDLHVQDAHVIMSGLNPVT